MCHLISALKKSDFSFQRDKEWNPICSQPNIKEWLHYLLQSFSVRILHRCWSVVFGESDESAVETDVQQNHLCYINS